MLIRSLLMGSTALRAPEDDRGAEFDDDLDTDLNLDELDPDGALDQGDTDDDAGDAGDRGDEDEDQGDSGADADRGRESGGGRRDRDVAGARRRAQEAERRADEAERRLNEVVNGQQQTRTAEQQRQEAERLANMSEAERLEYLIGKQGQTFQQELQRLRFEQQDSSDKVAFEALCARNPAAAKLASDVEKRLGDMRKTGTTAPRRTVLAYLIGDRALERAGQNAGKQRRKAADAVNRQTARPAGGARSDASTGDRRASNEREALAKRLDGLTF